MPFICVKAPKELRFRPDLASLGFKYADGKFVAIQSPHDYFEYYHTDDERTNNRRKEAMHQAVRMTVENELEKLGIKQLYLHGPTGTMVHQSQPVGSHVKIFATEVSKLRIKKDVIIVIGEAAAGAQDGGIWAYRVVMGEGGTEHGSAVGLAARIQAYGQSIRIDDIADDFEMVGLHGNSNTTSTRQADTTPGLIILNPGQLLYSHRERSSMTTTTWLARDRVVAIGGDFEIDHNHNLVQCHKTPHQHVTTFFEHILPQLVREDCRIYITCIGDAANVTLDYMDQAFCNKTETGLAKQLEAIVLVELDHQPGNIISEPLKNFLAVNGRSWVECHDLPYGRLVQTPKLPRAPVQHGGIVGFPIIKPKEESEDEKESTGSPNVGRGFAHIGADDDEDDCTAADYIDVKDEAYEDHVNDKVSCPTFSAGDCDGITETVWPKVMGDVLGFFWSQKAQAENMDQLREIYGPK